MDGDSSAGAKTLLAGSSKPGVGTSIVVGPTCGGSQGTATTTALRSNHSQATVSRIWGQWSRMDGTLEGGGERLVGVVVGIKSRKAIIAQKVSRLEKRTDTADSGQSSRKDSGRGRAHGQRAGTLYQVSRSNMGHGAELSGSYTRMCGDEAVDGILIAVPGIRG
jgi:hypothetical protein